MVLFNCRGSSWSCSLVIRKPGGSCQKLSTGPAVIFSAAKRHCPLATSKLYGLVTEACANNFLVVITWKWNVRDSSPWPIIGKSDALVITLPCHACHLKLMSVEYCAISPQTKKQWRFDADCCYMLSAESAFICCACMCVCVCVCDSILKWVNSVMCALFLMLCQNSI